MSGQIIGRVLISGDLHASSKNYGAHRDYPKETLEYFKNITDKAEELKVTHMIGAGDLTYGRFNTLEYRSQFERELERQNKITNGNRFELQGNHDTASYGMTEMEYYVHKGLLKRSTNIQIGVLNISMVDYGKHTEAPIITPSKDTISVVIAHDYFKFYDTKLPDYGNAILLDDMDNWYGVDYLICGHVHNFELFNGSIVRDNISYPMVVSYLGCMARPAYREGFMQDVGKLVLFTVYDNGEVEVGFIDMPLWPIEKSFNIEQKQRDKEKEEERHVDVSDIVLKLNSHERVIGNPEDIIMAMEDIDLRYRQKAIEWLQGD